MHSNQFILLLVAAGTIALLVWVFTDSQNQPLQPVQDSYLEHFSDGEQFAAPLPQRSLLDPQQVALGRQLFHDALLSPLERRCVDCHVTSLSQLPLDQAEPARVPLLNVALNRYFGQAGLVDSLPAQMQQCITDSERMGSDWEQIISRINARADYREAFRQLWAEEPSAQRLSQALQEYLRSLLTPGAALDRFLLGDDDAMSEDQKSGYRLFRDYGCVSCHQGVNLGGNLLVRFGLFNQPFSEALELVPNADNGGHSVKSSDQHSEVLRVPTLRNVALTAPYFHEGDVASLDEAVAQVGHNQLGRDIPADERYLIVEFLQALTGNSAALDDGGVQ